MHLCLCAIDEYMLHEFSVVSVPDPTDAAADGLHHRYASVGSGEQIRGLRNAIMIKTRTCHAQNI